MAQDLCSDILKWGIWSTSFRYEKEEFAQKTIEFFKKNKIYSKQDSIDAAYKAGITLPGDGFLIPMNFDGTFGKNKSENYSDAIVHYFENETEYKTEYINQNVYADTGIVQAWMKCQEYREANNPVLVAELEYAKVVESNAYDQITINLKAEIITENAGQIFINEQKLIQSLAFNGCELKSVLDPLKDGDNSIIIARKAEFRNQEGTIQIRTNFPSYSADCRLSEHVERKMPTIIKEIGTPNEVKPDPKNAEQTSEFIDSITNDKDKDVYLNIDVQFDLYGQNATAKIYVWVWRDEAMGEPIRYRHIVQWSDWARPQFQIHDIKFFKGSTINIKAVYADIHGTFFQADTTNIRFQYTY